MKIYGKKHALSVLSGFAASGRIPHALLFCGPEGIGKRTLADYTAMMYLCEKGGVTPCGNCNTCRRVEEHIHPDVVYPLSLMEKGKYQVDPLRDFITSCFVKPNDADLRVCIFESLDEMSPVCQNALLKFIEEPLSFNRYIFTAAKKAPVLQTVLSRLAAVEVDGADQDEFSAALNEKGISPERSEELFTRFGGNIGAALALEENSDASGVMDTAAKVADAISAGKELDCLISFQELKTREDIFAVLGILSDIFAQAAAIKAGRPASGAYTKQAEKLAGRYTLKTVTRLYDEAVRLYGMSFTNPNVRLFAAECCGSLFSEAEKKA